MIRRESDAAPAAVAEVRAPHTAAWIESLRIELLADPAANHLLLARFATGPYTRTDYRNFALQHGAVVPFFATYVEMLALGAASGALKRQVERVLSGHGEVPAREEDGGLGSRHAYARFLVGLGVRPGAENDAVLCPAVWDFVREHLRIVRDEPFRVALGALGPGHRWVLPKMWGHLAHGLRRAGFHSEEFAFFTGNAGVRESGSDLLAALLVEFAKGEPEREQIRRGARLSLAARFALWTGIEREIVRWRQPESVRAMAAGLYGPHLPRPGRARGGVFADLEAAAARFRRGGRWQAPGA